MKHYHIIKDYAAKADSMPPLEALRHITRLYMDQCGVSLTLRTVIYEAGEFWLKRLIESNKEWKEKLVDDNEGLHYAMRFFHGEYTLERYDKYDITGLNHDEWIEACDYMVGLLCHNIDTENNVVKPWDEDWMKAFCWGANEYIELFIPNIIPSTGLEKRICNSVRFKAKSAQSTRL